MKKTRSSFPFSILLISTLNAGEIVTQDDAANQNITLRPLSLSLTVLTPTSDKNETLCEDEKPIIPIGTEEDSNPQLLIRSGGYKDLPGYLKPDSSTYEDNNSIYPENFVTDLAFDEEGKEQLNTTPSTATNLSLPTTLPIVLPPSTVTTLHTGTVSRDSLFRRVTRKFLNRLKISIKRNTSKN